MKYPSILIISWFLSGCMASPPHSADKIDGAPWGITRTKDWGYVVLPGDTVIECDHDGRLYKQTWGFECPEIHVKEGSLPDDFTGTVYYDYGATIRIEQLDFVRGVVDRVAFVPWRSGTERTREQRILSAQPTSPISDWPNPQEKKR